MDIPIVLEKIFYPAALNIRYPNNSIRIMPLCFFFQLFFQISGSLHNSSSISILSRRVLALQHLPARGAQPLPSRAPVKPCRKGGSHIHHMICCVLSPGEHRTQSKVMRELAQLHLGARVWNDACSSFSKADLLLLKWLRSYICLLRPCLYAFASEVNGKYKIDSRLGERLASMMQPRPGRA